MTFSCRLKRKSLFHEQLPLVECITCPFEDCLYQGRLASLAINYRKALEKKRKLLEKEQPQNAT
jgi:hypothetical protein